MFTPQLHKAKATCLLRRSKLEIQLRLQIQIQILWPPISVSPVLEASGNLNLSLNHNPNPSCSSRPPDAQHGRIDYSFLMKLFANISGKCGLQFVKPVAATSWTQSMLQGVSDISGRVLNR